MAQIDEIKSVIKNTLEELDIAVVYDHLPHITIWDKVLQGTVKNNSLSLIMFSFSTRRSIVSEDNFSLQTVTGWRVKYLMSSSEKINSEEVFDRNIELICNSLSELSGIDYTIETVSPPEVTKPKGFETACGILCHLAEIEFEITKNT